MKIYRRTQNSISRFEMRYMTVVRVLALMFIFAGHLRADTIMLNAVDSGWYNNSSGHSPTNENYFAGQLSSYPGREYRNFFVFDLSSVTDIVIAATLRLDSGSYGGNDSSETYCLYNVTTSIADLRNDTGGLSTTFADLGSGILCGEREIFSTEENSIIAIELAPAGLSYLNNASGLIAFGGRVTTIGTPAAYNEYVFGGTGGSSTTGLVVHTIPEPATVCLLGLGSLVLIRHRKGGQ